MFTEVNAEDGAFDERAFDELAGRVADGEALDWQPLEETAGERRSQVEALAVIARIAAFHRSLRDSHPSAVVGGLADRQEPSECWGDLELLDVLGRGAYGTVYRARDPRLDREVALKLLRVPAGRTPETADSVIEEGRLLARVRHPNVVTVHGADAREGRVGIWMELIRGRTLADLVRENGPFSPGEAAVIGADLCRALAAVHGRGIVHRDIKAQNVMRERGGRIVLMDFGIGVPSDLNETAGTDTAGTPLYLAPEVLAGQSATYRSDLYALGVLLFFLVSGEFPVQAASLEELREAHRTGERQDLRDLCPTCPDAFAATVETALAADPEGRFGTAGEMGRRLARVGEGGGERVAPRRRSPLRQFFLGAALLLLLALAAGLALLHQRRGEALERLARADEVAKEVGDVEAVAVLQTAFDLFPPFPEGYARLAKLQDGLGRYVEAADSSDRAYELITESPFRFLVDEPERRRIIGEHQIYSMQYEQVLDSLRQAAAMRAGKWDSEACRQLSMLFGNLGVQNEAVTYARRAFDADPDDFYSFAQLPYQLAEAGRPEEALEILAESGFDGERENEHLNWMEGLAQLVAGRTAEARQAFERLTRGSSDYASRGYRFLGQTASYEALQPGLDPKARAELLAEAAGFLHRGLDLDDQLMRLANPAASGEAGVDVHKALKLLLLAEVERARGRRKEAVAALEQVESLPDVPVLLKSLRNAAMLEALLERPEELRALRSRIEGICEQAPSELCSATVLQLEGHQHALAGEADAARDAFEKAKKHRVDPLLLASRAGFEIADRGCEAARPHLEDLGERKGRMLVRESAVEWLLLEDRCGGSSLPGR